MQLLRKTIWLVLLFGAGSLLFPGRAQAYIDPGTGSYVLQMAVAGLLTTAYVVKLYWRKIIQALRSPFRKGSETKDDGR